jgi:uncharacterized protein (DUF433 family)
MYDSILGNGVYTFPEAAKLVGLRAARIREWFRGRESQDSRKPVFQSDYPSVDGQFAISFHDLVDVFVAGQLREYGVPLQTLRKIYAKMQDRFRVTHPFCRQELLTDGKAVFALGLDTAGQEEIIDVLTRQKVFPRIILPFLKRIDYEGATKLAARWRIADMVVVDPQVCFGKPIVEAAGITTAILSAAYHANGRNAELVADWFNVHPSHVLAAARFEGQLAA